MNEVQKNKIIHESHEFLKEKPTQDWEFKKGKDGFTLLKEKVKQNAELLKEYEDTARVVQQKFEEKFNEYIQSDSQLNIYLILNSIELFLKKEGLIRQVAQNPKFAIKFHENKILMELEIAYDSYFNSFNDLDNSPLQKLPEENYELITVSKKFKIATSKELIF